MMAAAPELLEALKAIVAIRHPPQTPPATFDALYELLFRVNSSALRAIAKAEGRT